MLEDNALVTRIVSRFHIIVTVILALIGAAILGASAGGGDFFDIYAILFGAAFMAIILALGDKYWMVVVFSFTAQLPAVPIQGRMLELPELAAILCSAVFLIRYAVKRQKFSVFRKQHVPVLLYTGWVVLIFALNPVGLSDAGSSLGGARFYAKIILGLAAFLIVANQEVSEKDCRTIIAIIIVGGILESVYQIGMFFLPLNLLGIDGGVQFGADPDSFYSWHQALAQVPILLICLGFARYKASEIFSIRKIWLPVVFALCVILIALSGKRAALASVPLFAISAAAARREWGALALWLTGATMAAGIVVIGQGELFRLPLTVQRALSTLPARWDSELDMMAGGQDLFREELRRQALIKIQNDPWLGTGYQVNLSLAQALSVQYATRGGDTELQVAPFAMGSAWHNTWLGYAADFGIPASVIAAIIYLSVFRRSWVTFRQSPSNSLFQTITLYIFIFTARDIAFSHTGGHSANDPFSRWWMYGLLVALELSNRKRIAEAPTAQVLTGGRAKLEPSFAAVATRTPFRVQRPVAS